jgi:hypothetical protein
MLGQGWVEGVVVDGVVVAGVVVLEEETAAALVVAAVTALAPMVAAAMPPAPSSPRVAAPARISFLIPNLVISTPLFLDGAPGRVERLSGPSAAVFQWNSWI